MSIDFLKGDLVRHERHGPGRVEAAAGWGEGQSCTVFFPRAGERLVVKRAELTLFADAALEAYDLVRLALAEQERADAPPFELAPRWQGGEVVVRPQDPELAAKTLPVEALFHKIVMVRDRLRVMEAQINAHKGLSDAEKVDLQQYVTRIYGSLTTFNFLFRDKKDWFVGQKGERD
jgi:hypothetical protein